MFRTLVAERFSAFDAVLWGAFALSVLPFCIGVFGTLHESAADLLVALMAFGLLGGLWVGPRLARRLYAWLVGGDFDDEPA